MSLAVPCAAVSSQPRTALNAACAAMLAGGLLVGISGPRLATLTAAGFALAAALVASRMLARGKIVPT